MARRVRIAAPATSANLGPGFDCLGMALDFPTEFELSESDRGIPWNITYEGTQPRPSPPVDGRNYVAKCVDRIFEVAELPRPKSLALKIRVGAPLARGLGSSATAIVGGMMAANEFLDRPLDEKTLLAQMVAMEGHPDNVVPCYVGGISSSLLLDGQVHRVRIEPASCLRCVVHIPSYSLSTEEARRAIPRTIPHQDATFNMARVPLVMEALRTGDPALIRAVIEDRLHEPYRKALVRDFDLIKETALNAGADAVILSGAGPTQLAFTTTPEAASSVATAWETLASSTGATIRILTPDTRGVRSEVLTS
jgi:homoserine kinase